MVSCGSMAEEEHQQRDWASGLPSLVVGLIADRLTAVDLVLFGAVCRSWAYELQQQLQFVEGAAQCPWVMIPTEDTGIHTPSRRFLSLTDGRSYKLTSPELVGKHVVGSDKGWLVLSDHEWGLSLLQPITRAHLPLPSLVVLPSCEFIRDPSSGSIVQYRFRIFSGRVAMDRHPLFFVQKVALSSNPSAGDCVVVIMCVWEVFFARPGDNVWTPIKIMRVAPIDVLFLSSHILLALQWTRQVVKIDFSTTQPEVTFLEELKQQGKFFCMHSTYLAICDGDIYAVKRRHVHISDPRRNRAGRTMMVTNNIILYKLHYSKTNVGGNPWVKTKDLKGHALFIGTNNCICLVAKDVPGVKENSIYFTDDFGRYVVGEDGRQAARDVVVFNLENDSYEFCYPPDDYLSYPPPIWFIPSLK